MRFEQVILYNFKNYKGKNSISFEQKKGKNKNITLIGGLNGAGKTTLLEAIKLCLYGKNFNGRFLSKNDYHEFIFSAVNRKAIKEKNPRCFVELKIIFDDSYPKFTLNIKRSWDAITSKKINETFEVFRDDGPLEFIQKEYWQEYIDHLIPPHVSEFFFFNGEKVKELAVGSTADEILKSSIKDLIGLNLYKNLQTDLNKLKSKIRRRNEKEGQIRQNINKNESERKIKENEKQKLEEKIRQNKINIQKNQREVTDIQKELKRKAGAFAQKKRDGEKLILTLKEKNAILNEKITNISKDYLPFVLPKKLVNELLNQLEYEQESKNIKYTEKTLKNHLKQFSKQINKESKIMKKLSKTDAEALEKEIKSTFLNIIKNKKSSNRKDLHDLTISDFENIKNFLHQSNKNISNNFEKILKERQENNLQIGDVKTELKQIPDDTYIISNLDDINRLKIENETLEKMMEELNEKFLPIEDEINSINSQIEKLEEEIICVEEDNEKIVYINRITSALNEYMKEMINLNTKNLENTISTMYHSLANKDDMVKEIKVDPETFTTKLFDYDGNPVTKDGISEGEKEIYAISVLWGLSNISHHKLPMIIDTPLSKLDNTHVNNITSKFFPKASDQVILLSQDREIDQNIYSLLKPHINQSYTLTQTDENKIKKGYFFN